MPQPRSSRSRSTASKPKSSSGSNAKAKSSSSSSAQAKPRTPPKPKAHAQAKTETKATAASGGPEARLEAAAQRLRKLNERIIEAGKEAGETTLSSYEKALEAIATSIEKGPGSSEVDWISHLATTQAKFIRDVTNAWTSAAREVAGRLK